MESVYFIFKQVINKLNNLVPIHLCCDIEINLPCCFAIVIDSFSHKAIAAVLLLPKPVTGIALAFCCYAIKL